MGLAKDRIAWADFRSAFTRISHAAARNNHIGSAEALARSDGLNIAMDELQDAFRHIHVRSDNGDKCALCDLDLRNNIHVRTK